MAHCDTPLPHARGALLSSFSSCTNEQHVFAAFNVLPLPLRVYTLWPLAPRAPLPASLKLRRHYTHARATLPMCPHPDTPFWAPRSADLPLPACCATFTFHHATRGWFAADTHALLRYTYRTCRFLCHALRAGTRTPYPVQFYTLRSTTLLVTKAFWWLLGFCRPLWISLWELRLPFAGRISWNSSGCLWPSAWTYLWDGTVARVRRSHALSGQTYLLSTGPWRAARADARAAAALPTCLHGTCSHHRRSPGQAPRLPAGCLRVACLSTLTVLKLPTRGPGGKRTPWTAVDRHSAVDVIPPYQRLRGHLRRARAPDAGSLRRAAPPPRSYPLHLHASYLSNSCGTVDGGVAGQCLNVPRDSTRPGYTSWVYAFGVPF